MASKKSDYDSLIDKDREIKKRLPRYLLILSVLIASLGLSTAYGASNVDHLKLYAHSIIIDYKQTQCFYAIVKAESGFDVKAKNGSHYGLIQMRNDRVKYMNGYAQIEMAIEYLKTRYGSICNGHRHLLKYGWQ